MCQLTYSNLKDPYLNSLMVYLLGNIGSVRHDDGCGFICSDNSYWKTKLAPKDIKNLGQILHDNILDDAPIPFHIRMATFGIEVTDENAHPFDGQHYLLMHNGTLVPKNGDVPKDKKKDSDSQKFLSVLDESTNKKKKETFETIFNNSMEEFAGKFAFIIRHKEDDIDYIIRGKTAELWITYISMDDKVIGYVINTSKETIIEALFLFKNLVAIETGVEYNSTVPVLLEQETIYVADELNIKGVGKTKENEVIKPKHEIIPFDRTSKWYKVTKSKSSSEIEAIIRQAKRINTYLEEHSMGLLDLQLIFQIVSGISLLEVTKEDLDMFIDYIIPKISVSDKVRKKVQSVLGDKEFPVELYKIHKLEYPWTLNNGQKILDILKEYNTSKVKG